MIKYIFRLLGIGINQKVASNFNNATSCGLIMTKNIFFCIHTCVLTKNNKFESMYCLIEVAEITIFLTKITNSIKVKHFETHFNKSCKLLLFI